MVEGLGSMHKAPTVPSMHKLGVVTYNCNPTQGRMRQEDEGFKVTLT